MSTQTELRDHKRGQNNVSWANIIDIDMAGVYRRRPNAGGVRRRARGDNGFVVVIAGKWGRFHGTSTRTLNFVCARELRYKQHGGGVE
ncbi:hypothetical protein EVAR_3773_1 [Eumeta japonica]|uniref:Uncharacterized protein n=1 Tax=Eumeta variegata TaxID=151549 RepID=A0A4C1SUE8_EUMVA|nr:hypothetical protein EVAR_3773_1 [Eumeta japonica]